MMPDHVLLDRQIDARLITDDFCIVEIKLKKNRAEVGLSSAS